MQKYNVSEDSNKFPLDNTANDSDPQNAVLNVKYDGAADDNFEDVNAVQRKEALRKHFIMSRAVDECAASLRTTLVRLITHSVINIQINVLDFSNA